MALRFFAAVLMGVTAFCVSPAWSAELRAIDRSPTVGHTYETWGYCIAPGIVDSHIDLILDGQPEVAGDAYREARQMRACRLTRVQAEYVQMLRAFDWPDRPGVHGEHWEIQLPDGRHAYLLIAVKAGAA